MASAAKPPKTRARILLMIDSPTTRDRDDALRVDRLPGGGWRATVHVAAVADHVPAGHPADAQARAVGWTQYHAHGTTPMLGRALEDATTLRHAEVRRSLAITVDFTAHGEVVASDVMRSSAANAVATNYAAAAERLASGGTDAMSVMLRDAHELATILLARRRDAGALAFYDLTRGIAIGEDGALVRLGRADAHPTYVIVQELMIAANTALARWSIAHEVPILFRNHQVSPSAPPAAEVVRDFEMVSMSTDPARDFAMLVERTRLVMKRATYGTSLRGHYGLNLPAYTHGTSPLRRYADLASQRNILAHLDGRPLPHSIDDLTVIAETLGVADDARRAAITEREKAADMRRTANALDRASGDLGLLTQERWLKALKMASRGPVVESIRSEIDRRATAGTLEHQAIALALSAKDASWTDIKAALLRYVEATDLAEASMLLSEHRQQHPNDVVDISNTMTGLSHQPTFVAHVVVNGTALPDESDFTAKSAMHRGAIAALRALHHLPHGPGRAARPKPSVKVKPAASPESANPIAWLNEHAQRYRLPAAQFSIESAGPSHLPTHRATVTYDGAPGEVGSAAAASKAEAKAQAAEQMREAVRARG